MNTADVLELALTLVIVPGIVFMTFGFVLGMMERRRARREEARVRARDANYFKRFE